MIILATSFSDLIIRFFSNFFGTPALLIGVFALAGSIIQRKKFSEIMLSTFKTIIGFLIIASGAGIISGSIGKFGAAFELLFNRRGFIANNDVIPGLFMKIEHLQWLASAGSLILIFGMILNLLIARFSNLKYVYLTGHSAWYFSTMMASVLALAGIPKSQMWLVVLIGSLLTSMWMVISPALLNPYVKEITKNDQLALAHTGSLSYLAAGGIGSGIKKLHHHWQREVKSTETINFPKGLNFLRNTNVAIALTMLVLFLFVYFLTWGVRGEKAMIDAGIINDRDSIIVQGILQAFTFAAGVEVLLIGVRMFIAEITPAFKGISDKFIFEAKPAMDCPIVFPFAPNAVIMGFLASVVGGLVMFSINIGVSSAIGQKPDQILGWAVIVIPSIIPHFFTGAASGVFGNCRGGIWGCLIGGFVNGLLIQISPWIFLGLKMIPEDMATNNQVIWGDIDYLVGIIPWFITKYLGGKWVLLGLSFATWFAIPVVSQFAHQQKMKKNIAYRELFLAKQATRKEFQLLIETNNKTYKEAIKQLKNSQSEKKIFQEEKEKLTKSWTNENRKLVRDQDKQLIEVRQRNIKQKNKEQV
ncbi:PTS system ascorbate-specific IIC component [Entomoplasma freundtii]|uniref:Ascorbate-specific PTS system EIIC component n=1 Tax=Entomoplasma freundtii TaxID=74700 RepID=A0A2K8NUK5_9MOLU|nr:PTS ascorbate transporter subunit IIC [Entomoplasma freundtii]ATZ16303.1 PTS system, ascorbate-specific IIC component [Entomoplasma freundtii]TDY56795.1 PTS system ascorbate-specific IIC component [Entomoplasma freundtii]